MLFRSEILQNNFKNTLAYSKKEGMIVTKCDLREPGLKHGRNEKRGIAQNSIVQFRGHQRRVATEPLQDG